MQGVFFRDGSRKKAKELNLRGSVRNELDGTVRIVAEGEERNLKEFMDWCKDGPEHSKVDKIDAEWFDSTSQFNDFLIK